MSTLPDRRVHCRRDHDGMELVRYDRAGKWYLEMTDVRRLIPRQAVDLDAAARWAVRVVKEGRGEIFHGVPGGQRFDHRVMLLMEEP